MEEENLDKPGIPDPEEHPLVEEKSGPLQNPDQDLIDQGRRKAEEKPGLSEAVGGATEGKPIDDLAREVDEHAGIQPSRTGSTGTIPISTTLRSMPGEELANEGMARVVGGKPGLMRAVRGMFKNITLRGTKKLADREAGVGKNKPRER